MKKLKKKLSNLFLFASFLLLFNFALVSVFSGEDGSVLATCDSDGAYGQTCIENDSVKIDKKVKIKGQSTFSDKVVGVKAGDTVEFRVTITNTGDVELDNLKTVDELPSEMYRTGGNGLTEEFSDLVVDAEKVFIIESKLNADEFATGKDFEKCVVNRVELTQSGDFRGSDTATVCYGNAVVEELPNTGPVSTAFLGFAGVVFAFVGGVLRKK